MDPLPFRVRRSAIGRLGALARLRERKIGIAANQGETL